MKPPDLFEKRGFALFQPPTGEYSFGADSCSPSVRVLTAAKNVFAGDRARLRAPDQTPCQPCNTRRRRTEFVLRPCRAAGAVPGFQDTPGI